MDIIELGKEHPVHSGNRDAPKQSYKAGSQHTLYPCVACITGGIVVAYCKPLMVCKTPKPYLRAQTIPPAMQATPCETNVFLRWISGVECIVNELASSLAIHVHIFGFVVHVS